MVEQEEVLRIGSKGGLLRVSRSRMKKVFLGLDEDAELGLGCGSANGNGDYTGGV